MPAPRTSPPTLATHTHTLAAPSIHPLPTHSPTHQPTDDNIINVRASSRVQPEGGLGAGGRVQLSLTQGVVFDK